MGRSNFITCLAPFQHEDHISYTITKKDVEPLFASLAHDIQKLQKGVSADSLTLQWCIEAVILLKKMHAEFLLLLQSLKVPMASWNGISKLWDEYMNESLNILELCNLLKSVINEMKRNLLKIDIASRCMSEGESLGNIQILAVQGMKLYGSLKWKNEYSTETPMYKTKSKNSIRNITCAIRGAITIISSILFCVIFYPIPVELEKEIHCELPQMKIFVDSVQELAQQYNDQPNILVGDLFVAFLGYEMIEQEITDTKCHTKTLIQEKSAALKVSLEAFELEVTKVFEEVLTGRSKLLQQITPFP